MLGLRTGATRTGVWLQDIANKEAVTVLSSLKVLEGYAKEYAASNTKHTASELILNYIRTGVERYNDSEWQILAGEEITGFVTYVAQQDALKTLVP